MPSVSAVSGYGGVSRQWAYYASYVAHLSAARSPAAGRSRPETPVEPVSAVRCVSADAPVRFPVPEPTLPGVEDLNNAAEHLARMRIVDEKEFNTFLMNSV